MKTRFYFVIVGTIIATSVIYASILASTSQEYYEIEIIGIRDTYLVGETYSFDYQIRGHGDGCATLEIAYPDENGNVVKTITTPSCVDGRVFDTLDIRSVSGSLGNVAINVPGTYQITITYSPIGRLLSATKVMEFHVVEHSKTENGPDSNANLSAEQSFEIVNMPVLEETIGRMLKGFNHTLDAGARGSFEINGSVVGARISEISFGHATNSVHVNLEESTGGHLVITVPRNLFDPKIENKDDSFIVLSDNVEVPYGETANESERTLTIDFPAKTKEIEIVQTFPLFGEKERFVKISLDKFPSAVKVKQPFGNFTIMLEGYYPKYNDPNIKLEDDAGNIIWTNYDDIGHVYLGRASPTEFCKIYDFNDIGGPLIINKTGTYSMIFSFEGFSFEQKFHVLQSTSSVSLDKPDFHCPT